MRSMREPSIGYSATGSFIASLLADLKRPLARPADLPHPQQLLAHKRPGQVVVSDRLTADVQLLRVALPGISALDLDGPGGSIGHRRKPCLVLGTGHPRRPRVMTVIVWSNP